MYDKIVEMSYEDRIKYIEAKNKYPAEYEQIVKRMSVFGNTGLLSFYD